MLHFLTELVSLFQMPKRSAKPAGSVLPSKLENTPRCANACAFAHCTVLAEAWFNRVLSLERKRSERSRVPFMLVLLGLDETEKLDGERHAFVHEVTRSLMLVTRETDVTGWYQNGKVLGAIFTELGQARDAQRSIVTKINSALEQRVGLDNSRLIRVSCHLYPEPPKITKSEGAIDVALYPDQRKPSTWLQSSGKRASDIIGSIVALVLLSPLFLILAAIVKMTSRGPALFRQNRIGQHGKPFTFLKFRTMKVLSRSTIHQRYIKEFISGAGGSQQNGVYKIQHDSRVTAFGGWLRRTSLDELPQFWNVLKGDMSLVGPRPAIPYEVEMYDLWHRRRHLRAKPGITGLWQIMGRSRTTFDEMVRLDLRYVESSSPWLDLKILWRTPLAVASGSGAY